MGTSNIADKVVVITGASSGLGESMARLLAAGGRLQGRRDSAGRSGRMHEHGDHGVQDPR